MEPNTKETGKLIFNTVSARKCGLMAPSLRVNIKKAKSMGVANTSGKIIPITMASGLKTRFKAAALIRGQTIAST